MPNIQDAINGVTKQLGGPRAVRKPLRPQGGRMQRGKPGYGNDARPMPTGPNTQFPPKPGAGGVGGVGGVMQPPNPDRPGVGGTGGQFQPPMQLPPTKLPQFDPQLPPQSQTPPWAPPPGGFSGQPDVQQLTDVLRAQPAIGRTSAPIRSVDTATAPGVDLPPGNNMPPSPSQPGYTPFPGAPPTPDAMATTAPGAMSTDPAFAPQTPQAPAPIVGRGGNVQQAGQGQYGGAPPPDVLARRQALQQRQRALMNKPGPGA